jgi:UDP-glucose 4-epimerase
MTTLVTGGAGYIGSHFVHTLADLGRPVIVLDNLSTGNRKSIPRSVPLVAGDVGDEALVAETIAKHNVGSIVHFAASTVVPDSIADPLAYYRNNTANARTLIECAVAGNVRKFLFSSTAAIYGNPTQNPVSEEASPLPLSPYGTSKYMTELMLRDTAAAHDFKYVTLRYFNVAGADPKMRTGQSTKQATHLIKVAVQAVIGLRGGLEVFGNNYPTPDGTCVRDYIHVADLANAHALALEYLDNGGDCLTCNCGYGRGYSVLEVIEAVKRVSGSDFPVRISARRAGDPASIVANATRIRDILGWTAKFDDLDQIVRHALTWEQKIQFPEPDGEVR